MNNDIREKIKQKIIELGLPRYVSIDNGWFYTEGAIDEVVNLIDTILEEKDKDVQKARIDMKIDMIGIFHGAIESVYGREFADNMMRIVNAYVEPVLEAKYSPQDKVE